MLKGVEHGKLRNILVRRSRETTATPKDTDPLTVVFGGPHSRMPSIGMIKVGDVIYPITVFKGHVVVMARMKVNEIMDADCYTVGYLGVGCRDLAIGKGIPAKEYKGHQIPQTCCAKLAALGTGSIIEPRYLQLKQLPQLTFKVKKGLEPLKLKDGKASAVNFSGFFRRMSDESVKLIDSLF